MYHGVDWGWYPDPWAYNAVHYDAARRTLVIFDELTRRRTPNRETARLLLDRDWTARRYVPPMPRNPKAVRTTARRARRAGRQSKVPAVWPPG